jgi:hypothetical protein
MRGLTVPSAYLEYPVWRWYEWPWIEAPVDRGARSAVDAARAFARSVQLLRECRWRVPIGEVRDQKSLGGTQNASLRTRRGRGLPDAIRRRRGRLLEAILRDPRDLRTL